MASSVLAAPALAAPHTPTKVRASHVTKTSIRLAWKAVPGAKSYRVFVRTATGKIHHVTKRPSFRFKRLAACRTYSLGVRPRGKGAWKHVATKRVKTAGCGGKRHDAARPANKPATKPAHQRKPQAPQPAPQPAPAPAPSGRPASCGPRAVTQPVGWTPRSDAEAWACVVRHPQEQRPDNADENARVLSDAEVAGFRAKSFSPYKNVIGNGHAGTTDEILQFVSYKFGIDEDITRAAAINESNWHMSQLGDFCSQDGAYASLGILQIRTDHGSCGDHPGTYPFSGTSTSFNAAYWAAQVRAYYDGKNNWASWLNESCCSTGVRWAPGDIWGAVGTWFAGRWHNGGANDYIAKAQGHFRDKPWLRSGF